MTNGPNETITTAWDPICGVPTSTTNANNQTTTFQTDALCRPTTTTLPLGGFETRSNLSFGNPNAQRVKLETPSATPSDGSGNFYVESYFDGMGRSY